MEHLTQEQLSALLRSPEAQQLVSLLQQQNPVVLQQSITAAKQGNLDTVKSLLGAALSGTDAQRLANKLKQQLE